MLQPRAKGSQPYAHSELRGLAFRMAEAMPRLGLHLRRALAATVEHDALNLAQAAAYSSLVSLFPALIVAATVVTWLPDNASIRLQGALFFDRILPPDVSPLLESYFENGHPTHKSTEAILIAAVVSLVSASGVIVTLMEGFRRAFDLSPNEWSFWEKRWRSLALVPIALFPLALASSIIIFGHVITEWLAAPFAALHTGPALHTAMFAAVVLIRWAIALASSIGVIGAIYHMGVPPFCLGEEATVREPDRFAVRPGKAPEAIRDWSHLVRSVQTTLQSSMPHLIPNSISSSIPSSVQSSVSTLRAMSTLERSWTRTLPGAILATALWFFTTLGFGWYVTRYANYSEVYGSLGVGIALLFWLFLLSLSILIGAEFNAQLYPPVHSQAPEMAAADYPAVDPELSAGGC